MKARRSVRDIVIGDLEVWGEWEAQGLYQEGVQRSVLGRLVKDGPGVPHGAAGASVPLGVYIPDYVTEMGRLVADMRERCRAGERYHRLIRRRFVLGDPCAGEADALERAVAWLVAEWLGNTRAKKALQSAELAA